MIQTTTDTQTSMTTIHDQMTPAQRRQARLGGIVGNVVEWYDFALYGYLAVVIGKLFFPAENPTVSLLASYGVFAAGFVMRPIGAAVFGWLGDTIGRAKTMLISVAMMAFPTIALGLLPDYQTIGIAAPILLIIIRLIQGLSVGGEFSSSVTYMVETAPEGSRGRAGSWANVGSISGMLLGSAAAALVTTIFTGETLEGWGWRLPFLFGGVLGLGAIMLRRHLPKSPHFKYMRLERHRDHRSCRFGLEIARSWFSVSVRCELRDGVLPRDGLSAGLGGSQQ